MEWFFYEIWVVFFAACSRLFATEYMVRWLFGVG
jgi:hypothetical protein